MHNLTKTTEIETNIERTPGSIRNRESFGDCLKIQKFKKKKFLARKEKISFISLWAKWDICKRHLTLSIAFFF